MNRTKIINVLKQQGIKIKGTKVIYSIGKQLGKGGNGVVFEIKSSKKELVAKFYIPPDSRDFDPNAYKRFQNEVELSKKTMHPFVICSQGVGVLEIGSFRIPYYLMARAICTFSDLIPKEFSVNEIYNLFEIYTRTLMGVSYLHSNGIVHRDIKPKNILIFPNNIPRIADLGIAHVQPGFIKCSKLTASEDKLMNQDYYAPEQRYRDATKVDHRADIYALGCILYEMISGIPANRPNLPSLEDIDGKLLPFDKIFKKMTEHNPAKRYQNLDIALDEIIWALKKLNISSEIPSSNEENKKLLLKYIKSTNIKTRNQAIEIARKLDTESIPVLIELLGNSRLDISISAYNVLGDLVNEASIPYLIAGLYPRRTSKKLVFPTSEAAAKSIRNFSKSQRIEILKKINDFVQSKDIKLIINDFSSEEIYETILSLYTKKLFYEDWANQTGLSLLLEINEENAWILIEQLISKQEHVYSFVIFQDIFPYVSIDHKIILIDYLISNPLSLSSWDLPKILYAVEQNKFSKDYKSDKLNELIKLADTVIKKYYDRKEFIKLVEKAMERCKIKKYPQSWYYS